MIIKHLEATSHRGIIYILVNVHYTEALPRSGSEMSQFLTADPVTQ